MKINSKITKKGAILLGEHISCDGFVKNNGFRIQTHVHEDHMTNFSSSIGYQKGVILTKPTLDLITVIRKEEALSSRNDIHIIEGNGSKMINNFNVEFFDSQHMLGAVQVVVEYPQGLRCGYSGDFSWPLENVVQTDELVIDSTYGSPESVRPFSQEYVEERLLDFIGENLSVKPIIIISRRGTIQRAMHSINSNFNIPMILSKRLIREIEVYNMYGYNFTNYFSPYSDEAQEILESKKFLRFYGTGDFPPNDTSGSTVIHLQAIFGRHSDPIVNYDKDIYTVAYSCHADFNDTLKYVKASNSKVVICDPTRSGFEKARKLANEIKKRLKIQAYLGEPIESNHWGE